MFRTKFFQLAFPAYLFCVHMVLCQLLSEGALKDNKLDSGQEVTRSFHLVQNAKCSGKFIEIKKRTPLASSTGMTRYTKLEVKTRPTGGMTIMGKQKNLYICFSKNAKLITRFNPNENCYFNDTIINGYTVYFLRNKPSWKLGFSRTGKPIRGNATHMRHTEKCMQFMEYGKDMPEPAKNGPNLPNDIAEEFLNNYKAQQEVTTKPRRRVPPQKMRRKRRTPKPRTLVRTTTELSVSNRSTGVLEQRTTPVPLARVRRREPELLRTLRVLKLLS